MAVEATALTSEEAVVCGFGVHIVINDTIVSGLLWHVSDGDGALVGSTCALWHCLWLVDLHLAHAFRSRAHELLLLVVLVILCETAARHFHETLTLSSRGWLI